MPTYTLFGSVIISHSVRFLSFTIHMTRCRETIQFVAKICGITRTPSHTHILTHIHTHTHRAGWKYRKCIHPIFIFVETNSFYRIFVSWVRFSFQMCGRCYYTLLRSLPLSMCVGLCLCSLYVLEMTKNRVHSTRIWNGINHRINDMAKSDTVTYATQQHTAQHPA